MKTSQPAKAVAREVIAMVGKGKKPNIGKIARSKGYSVSSSRASKPQRTASYKAEIQPLVTRLEAERDAIVTALKSKRGKAKYRDLIDGLDKITKNLQLLTGGATENVAVLARDLSDNELERIANGG